MKKADSNDIALGHLLLEAFSKTLADEETLLNFSDRSRIRDFADVTIVLF